MYKRREHVHFVGIGGIGMSGIAEILRLRGYTVSGCDSGGMNKTIEHLQNIGCIVHNSHDVSHIHNADVLVYSSAVCKEDPEVAAAFEKRIPVIPRALMLGELMRTKYSVAVSGAHGKTTTTSLISHIMIEAGRQPTVVIGGILKNIANNAQFGNGEIFIAEADESDRSLLYLTPTMAIVTNIDAEHLDTYVDLDDIKETFKSFLSRLPFYGKAFVCIDDPHVQSILPLPHIPTIRYGIDCNAEIIGYNLELNPSSSTFDVAVLKALPDSTEKVPVHIGSISLSIPGRHNVLNALAAIGVCLEFDIQFENISNALHTFKGVVRRFEFKGSYKGADIFDDYGHHPTEIRSTFQVAQKRVKNDLHVIFQPHRFTRTQKLWQDFVDLFAHTHTNYPAIKTIYIADIYAASEHPIDGITSDRLVAAINAINQHVTIEYVSSYAQAVKNIENKLNEGDLLLTIGAGKVDQVADMLLQSALSDTQK